MSDALERRIAGLEEALMETRLQLRELKEHLSAVNEAVGLTAKGGLAALERIKRMEARMGMEP